MSDRKKIIESRLTRLAAELGELRRELRENFDGECTGDVDHMVGNIILIRKLIELRVEHEGR